jgi:HPt (histidine-containing phosphotransfer) domain-containing protein
VLVEMRDAFSIADAQAIERAAHGLKGSVSNFGAAAAVEAALELEIMGRTGNLENVAFQLNNLHQILTSLHGELSAL